MISVTVLCLPFYIFKDELSVVPPFPDDFNPSVALVQFTEASSMIYDSEAHRSAAVTPLLSALIGGYSFTTKIVRPESLGPSGWSPDIVIQSTITTHEKQFDVVLLIREDKNELSSTGNDPTRQCAITYEKIILHVSPVLIFSSLSVADITVGVI